ncbi:hypothetical protein ACQ4PT_009556 [Festuca glaucescens]
MVDEEDDDLLESEGSSSRRSYFDVVRDGTPSPARAGSPSSPLATLVVARSPPVRQLPSVVVRPAQQRADGGLASRGDGGRKGPQPKRQRRREPLPSFFVPAGVPAGLAGLCFNCAEPGHVAGRCEGPRRCLNCKSENHIALQCTAPGAVAVAHVYEPVEAEMPYERGLRRERAIRESSLLRQEEAARGETLLGRALRREQELRDEALASVARRPPLAAMRSDEEVVAEFEAARPPRERCVIYRTPEVDDAEHALRWGVVAFVSGTRRSVTSEAAVAAVLAQFPSLEGHFSVHRFWPAEFLFVFDSRASRDTLLAANPLDARDFSLRFGLWNSQRQASRRVFRYRVHLEVVGVPPVAWSMATAKSILGSSAWVERLGAATASRADMGCFRVTAWTDNPSSIPRSKEIWLAEHLFFDNDDDDLLLPLDALIPDEVALLDYEVTVHIVRVEDLAARPSSASGAGGGDRDRDPPSGGNASGGNATGGSAGPGSDPRGSRDPGRGAAAGSGQDPSRRWRGGVERRVALVPATSVAPWDPPAGDVDVVGPVGQPAATVQPAKDAAQVCSPAFKACGAGAATLLSPAGLGQKLRPPSSPPLAASGASAGGSGGSSGSSFSPAPFDQEPLHVEVDTNVVCSRESSRAQGSPSIHELGWPRWPPANPVLWPADGPWSPTEPLSPARSIDSVDSDVEKTRHSFGKPLSMFTVVLTSPEREEGEIVELPEEGEIVEQPPTACSLPPVANTHSSTPPSSSSDDMLLRLASFRDRCRARRQALLPRSVPKPPRKRRALPSMVRRSRRVAGRFATCTPIKQQQKTIMVQLGIAHEGEIIDDATLDAYLRFFDKPVTERDLAACLALFGWLPSALPPAGDDVEGSFV